MGNWLTVKEGETTETLPALNLTLPHTVWGKNYLG